MRVPVSIPLAAFLLASASASAQTGTLKVTSYPSGASVVIDGQDTGKTTPMSSSVSVGSHSVMVFVPDSGWNPDTRTVTVAAGNNDLSVTLLPRLTVGPEGPAGPPGATGPRGAEGSAGPAGPQGPAGAGNGLGALGVFDGIGQRIGDHVGGSGVTVEADGRWFTVLVTSSDFLSNGMMLYYPNADCSGTPYAWVGSVPGQPITVPLVTTANVIERVAWFPDMSVTPMELAGAFPSSPTPYSSRFSGPGGTGLCQLNTFNYQWMALVPLLSADLSRFVGPFHLGR